MPECRAVLPAAVDHGQMQVVPCVRWEDGLEVTLLHGGSMEVCVCVCV